MKKILLIVFSGLIFLNSFFQFAIILYYKINQEYIAQVLCENRNNPESSCQGKCYLQKQLKKHEHTENQSNSLQIKYKEIQLFYNEIISLTFNLNILNLKVNTLYLADPILEYQEDIFHPPTS